MFGMYYVRFKIALVWVLLFTALWITFQSIFPTKSMEYQLDKIEESIQNDDWDKASELIAEFRDNFKNKRVYIQMNNSTEALANFEHTIGQLEMTIKYRQESAIEFVGALRETINLVIIPFSGP